MENKWDSRKQVRICLVAFFISIVLVASQSCPALSRGSYNLYVTVTVLPKDGGSVICNSQYLSSSENADRQTYTFATTQTGATFTAQPAEGHVFLGWYQNNEFEGNLSVITVPTNNVYSLMAVFSPTYNQEVVANQQQDTLINNMTWSIVILAVAVSILVVVLSITILRGHRKKIQTLPKHS